MYGGDILLTPARSIAVATGVDGVNQRILRRVISAAGNYLWHPKEGVGAGKDVGAVPNQQTLSRIKARINGAVLYDDDVAKSPAPMITFDTKIANLLSVTIKYTYAPTGQLQTLSFNLPNG